MTSKMEKIIREIPLDIRLNVANQLFLILALAELGYRDNVPWSDDEKPLLNKIGILSKEHTTNTIKIFQDWEDDGKPKNN